jgi:predicted ATP-grasp superfamily ATP-dependent carboligase
MDYMSRVKDGKCAIAYTVWSRKRGAGKEIINKLAEYAKQNHFKRVVTLSPLTPMATHFHIKNGAKQIKVSEDTQNFEYDLNKKI